MTNRRGDLIRKTGGLCREQRRTACRRVRLEMTNGLPEEMRCDASQYCDLRPASRDPQFLKRRTGALQQRDARGHS